MGKQELNLFEQYLFEAPEDEVPDADMGASTPDSSSPPALDDSSASSDGTGAGDFSADAPPSDSFGDDSPPEMGGDDFGGDDLGSEGDGGSEGENDQNASENQVKGLDDKVSSLMNYTLYKRFLTVLTQITSQQSSIKNNSDILYTISADTAGIVKSLSKLEDNIRLYLDQTYTNMNYTRNLLFFNKCINLLHMINDQFDKVIRHGMSDHQSKH